MTEKPLSGDPEQRAQQTRAAREQSGLPPEEESSTSEENSDRNDRAEQDSAQNEKKDR